LLGGVHERGDADKPAPVPHDQDPEPKSRPKDPPPDPEPVQAVEGRPVGTSLKQLIPLFPQVEQAIETLNDVKLDHSRPPREVLDEEVLDEKERKYTS
jgi:hypothetical protein